MQILRERDPVHRNCNRRVVPIFSSDIKVHRNVQILNHIYREGSTEYLWTRAESADTLPWEFSEDKSERDGESERFHIEERLWWPLSTVLRGLLFAEFYHRRSFRQSEIHHRGNNDYFYCYAPVIYGRRESSGESVASVYDVRRSIFSSLPFFLREMMSIIITMTLRRWQEKSSYGILKPFRLMLL